jgi:pilus assembly protein CpaC
VPSASDASKAVEITQSMIAASPISVSSGASTGTAASATATSSTQTYAAGSGPGIVNLLTITGEEQVALKVSVVEVQRSVVKQLGINMKGVFLDGGFGVGTNLASSILGATATGVGGSPINFGVNSATNPAEIGMKFDSGANSVQGTLQALEETRMLRTLAEPTLTAVSGETANFLAGGEFPVPVAGDNGQITVEFKQFGVNLAFTPVVLSPGRIALKLRSEVSDISATGAVSVPISSTSTVTIPATSVRRAETSIELPSGGSFMVAGLIQENTRRAASGLPWLQHIPILGSLFSSKDFLNDQSELVMIVTAYLVKPVGPQALARPDDNLFMANDAESYFLNKLTKVYGTEGQVPTNGNSGQVGFTFD